MEKSRKPKIRFKGFTDDWEQRKLEEIVQITMGQSPDGSTYSNEPSDYILIQGNADLLNGWVSPRIWTTQITKKADAGDLIMSVRAPAGSMGKTAYDAVIGRGVAAIKGNEFIYQLLVKMDEVGYWKTFSCGSTFESLSSDTIKNAKVNVTLIAEQTQIGLFLNQLDSLITLHQRKLDKLVNVKKSMLEKMFPQQGGRIPEIRFCGFTDDWEQRKLVELLTKYTDEVNVPHNGYERLGIRSHAKGTFHSYVSEGHELQTGKMHKVAADKFIVNITFGWEHAVAVTDKNDAGKLVSHRFPQYSLSENLYSKFFKYIILDDKFKHHLWLSSPGGAGRNRVLKLDEMLEYKIKIPNVQEQQKIAEVLMDLDHLITLHQRKLEKLKNIKKSMLEKMFI